MSSDIDTNNGEDVGSSKRLKLVTMEPMEEVEEDFVSAPTTPEELNTADNDATGGDDEPDVEMETPAFIYQYHVVKRILEHLNLFNVFNASQVNKQWADIGKIVRKQRKNEAFTLLFQPYHPHHKLAFEYFNGFEVSVEATQLVESGKNDYFPYQKRCNKPKFPGVVAEARSALREAFLKAYDEPQLLVSFATSSLLGHLKNEYNSENRKRPRKEKNADPTQERVKLILGGMQTCAPCITSFTCGVVAALPEAQKSLELEKEKFPCLTTLAIPKVAGLVAKPFSVTKEQCKSLRGKWNEERLKQILGVGDDEANLKAIMLLHNASFTDPLPFADAVMEYLKLHPRVALAGGVHDRVMISDRSDDTIIAGGILFFGNELVRVSSIALKDAKMTRNNQSKIEELKSTLKPNEKSFAFMFACNGRGRGMHDHPNVESDLFNSYFPKTPLVGSFTFGEFCHEVIGSNSDNPEAIAPPNNISYSYTTVFLLVTYKHPAQNREDA